MRQNTSYIAWTVERLRTLCKARKVLSASTRFFILNSSFFILLSCSIMDDGPDALSLQDGSTAQVAFTLKLDKAQPATRTTWGDNYPDKAGTGYENRIDQLQVVLYSKDNAAYPLHNLWQETSATQGGGQDTYTFVGSIDTNNDDSPRAGKYKIMVFANCEDISEENNLGNLTYQYTYTDSEADPAIPMWGVTTTTLNLTPGEREEIGNIDLLRAVAKVEVQLQDNNDTQGFSLTGVTISTANTQGYCLPAGYANVNHTKELDREDGNTNYTFHPYPGSTTTTALAFVESNGTYTLYLPEYDNGTGNTPATLSVTVTDEDNRQDTYTLEFRDYTDGRPTGEAYDIVRNHLYRYTITKIDNGQLTVQHRVMPWDKVSTAWGAGGYACQLLPEGYEPGNTSEMGDIESRLCILYRPSYADNGAAAGTEGYHAELKTGSAGARYEFTLTAPEGAVWTAHLTNTDVFSFSQSTEGGQKMVSTGIARKEPYLLQINVNGSKAWTEGTSFDDLAEWGQQMEASHDIDAISTYFYITVSVDGGHEEELVINPANALQEGEPTYYRDRRRYAGTDTRIWIRQVPAQSGWSYDELAEDTSPTDESGYYWWRVNPYWSH